MPAQRQNKASNVVLLFFLVYYLAGLVLSMDYGVPWDDPFEMMVGSLNVSHILGSKTPIPYPHAFKGPVFEVMQTLIARAAPLHTSRSGFFLRHAVVFTSYFLSVVVFYFLLKKRFSSRLFALFGTFFLVISPRFFAEGFYNGKDILFLSLWIWSLWAWLRYYESPSLSKTLALGAVLGLATTIRTGGIFGVFAFFVISSFDLRRGSKRYRPASVLLREWLVLLASFAGTVYLFWPYLWANPIKNFLFTIHHTLHRPGPPQTLYLGETYFGREFPWHYLPVWIGITVPIVVLVFFIAGLWSIIRKIAYSEESEKAFWSYIFFWLAISFAGTIILKPVLYDGWRYFYYLYPGIVLIAVEGLSFIAGFFRTQRARSIFFLAVMLACLPEISFLMRNHPNQQVYFNYFAGPREKLRERFELDYWGLSYRQGLEFIAKTDPRKSISIHAENEPGYSNIMILPPQDIGRFKAESDLAKADYFLSNYRLHPEEYTIGEEVHSVFVDGAKILTVRKLR